MIWDRLCLKTQCLKLYDLRKTLSLCWNCKENLGILEDAVWSPNWIDPLHIENPELNVQKYFFKVNFVLSCLTHFLLCEYSNFSLSGNLLFWQGLITYSPLPCSEGCVVCGLSSWGPKTYQLQRSSRSDMKKKIKE